MAELDDIISRADVVDLSKIKGSTIRFGATVRVVDEDTDEKITYQIVGTHESDIASGLLSVTSPLARALIGKGRGESVEVSAPGGSRCYEIVQVSYN